MITSTAPRKIALVIGLGKINDGTFNQFAHEGMERAAADLGLEYTYVETGNLTDLDRSIQALLDDGYPLIVTVGVFLQDATRAAARANPRATFVGVDQTHNGENALPNLVGLQFREDQAGFLAGAMAALMSESGTVGIVAGPDLAAIKRFKNGFDSGARYVRPDVELLGVYLESFVDPATGGSTALQLIGEGADVIFGAGGATGSGAIKAAAEAGAYVIGVDQDEYFTTFGGGAAPGAGRLLTSAIKRVDVAVYDQILRFYAGQLQGGDVVYDAEKGAIGFAPFHDAPVPAEVQARLDEILAQLAAGTLATGVDPLSGDPLP